MSLFNTRDLEGNESEDTGYSSSSTSSSNSSSSESIQDSQADISISLSESTLDNPAKETPEDSDLHVKVRSALEYFDTLNLKLVDFLDGLSWGDANCVCDTKIRMERNILFQSPDLLHDILQRWARPPRPKGSSKARPAGGTAIMDKFARLHVAKVLNHELETIAGDLKSPTSIDVDKETLVETSFSTLSTKMESKTPMLWQLLDALASRKSQRKRNIHKTSVKVSQEFQMNHILNAL